MSLATPPPRQQQVMMKLTSTSGSSAATQQQQQQRRLNNSSSGKVQVGRTLTLISVPHKQQQQQQQQQQKQLVSLKAVPSCDDSVETIDEEEEAFSEDDDDDARTPSSSDEELEEVVVTSSVRARVGRPATRGSSEYGGSRRRTVSQLISEISSWSSKSDHHQPQHQPRGQLVRRSATLGRYQAAQRVSLPSYVPSYIGRVPGQQQQQEMDRGQHCLVVKSIPARTSPTLRRLRGRSGSEETRGVGSETSTVPVQSAIANMEKKNSSSSVTTTTRTAESSSNKHKPPMMAGSGTSYSSRLSASTRTGNRCGPADPRTTNNFLRAGPQGRISRNSRNRRSMSDPNIQKTFLEVKKLWDEKIQSEKGLGKELVNKRTVVNIRNVVKPASAVIEVAPSQVVKPAPPATNSTAGNQQPPGKQRSAIQWGQSRTPTKQRGDCYERSLEREVRELDIEKSPPPPPPSTATTSNRRVFETAMLFGPTSKNRTSFKQRSESQPPPLTSVKKEEEQAEETHQEVEKRPKSPPPPVPEKPKSPTRTKAQQEQQKQQESETTKTETEETTAEAEEPSQDKEVEEEETRADDSSTTLKMSAEQQQLEQTATEEDSNKENNNDDDDDGSEASLEEHKATIDDVTARDIAADDFDALKRNGHSALERRASGSRKNQSKNGAAPIKSFLHGDGVRRRNSTATATAPPSVELHLCADQHKQEERLSGEEEMLERRRERLKRREEQASPDRPRLLQIDRAAARSRAHTLENMADASPMVRSLRSSTMTSPPVRGGDETEEMISSPVSSSSAMSTASSSVRPDSISSCMSTTSGEFNLASEYDKIARQLADDDDDDERAEDGDVIDDETLKRGGGKKRNVETQGDRKSVEVPSKQRAEDWHDDEADKGEAPLDAPVKPQVVEDAAQPVPEPPPPPPLQQQQQPEPESIEKKLFNIAKELLTTEEKYVEILYLIDQVFHKMVKDAVASKSIIPDQVVTGIFGHISPIYNFHKLHLLPQLQERIKQWKSNPRIGDIMVVAAPFFKMYSLYVQHFPHSMELIKTWSHKSSAFQSIMDQIHKRPECGGLTLQNHMLTPVQRIPRYQLLLKDYLKRLPEDSPDYSDATVALEKITDAATHSNSTIAKLEKFQKLVQIFNQLSDVNFDMVDVSRELYKEGKITKISARSGEKQERYLYLFSDMLVCCAPLSRLTASKSYRVTAKIDLEGMHVGSESGGGGGSGGSSNPNSTNTNTTFCVRGLQKTMEFQASNEVEKDKWISALHQAIAEYNDRMSTFKNRGSFSDGTPSKHHPEQRPQSPTSPTGPPRSPLPFSSPSSSGLGPEGKHAIITDPDKIGKRAPKWIKDNEVTMCMCCSKPFNKLLRRRHHCRACGRVICSECSEHKWILQYDPSKPQRICTSCYKVLRREKSEEEDKKGVLEVEADEVTEQSVIADYLYFCEGEKKKNWTRMWCVIPKDQLCVYLYAAHQDVRAQSTLPLPGFSVSKVSSGTEHKYAFKVSQARKVMYFGVKDKATMERWIYAISHASRGEDLTRASVHSLGKCPAIPAVQDSHHKLRKGSTASSIGSRSNSTKQGRVVSSSSEEDFCAGGAPPND